MKLIVQIKFLKKLWSYSFKILSFSTVKEIFLDQEIFPQSRKFSLIKEIFHSHRNFRQNFFSQTRKFSTVKDIFHTQKKFFNQENFPQTKKFSTNFFSLIKEVFHSQKRFFQNKDQRGSLKVKVLDSFNIELYVKIFLTLKWLLVTNGHTY